MSTLIKIGTTIGTRTLNFWGEPPHLTSDGPTMWDAEQQGGQAQGFAERDPHSNSSPGSHRVVLLGKLPTLASLTIKQVSVSWAEEHSERDGETQEVPRVCLTAVPGTSPGQASSGCLTPKVVSLPWGEPDWMSYRKLLHRKEADVHSWSHVTVPLGLPLWGIPNPLEVTVHQLTDNLILAVFYESVEVYCTT